MTEERLKEIKDSIDYKLKKMKPNIFLDEQLELYNEVIRLREIIDKATEYINDQKTTISKSQADLFNEDRDNKSKLKIGTFMWNVDKLLDILKENKNE